LLNRIMEGLRNQYCVEEDGQLKLKLHKYQVITLAGFTSGLLQAGLFNPWDRALYLSVKNQSRFLSLANFRNPYQGFSQSIFSRVLSGGSYFPLVDVFEPLIAKKLNQEGTVPKALAGHAAGAVNGSCINFLTAIKYETWGRAEAQGLNGTKGPAMFRVACDMHQSAWRGAHRRAHREWGYHRKAYREATRGKKPSFWSWHPRHRIKLFLAGFRPFTKGIAATVLRDSMFGGMFALIKEYTKPSSNSSSPFVVKYRKVLENSSILFAGLVATISSAPWNYARNIKYSTPPGQRAPSIWCCLKDLYRDARTAPCGSLPFLQQRLRIGWGTARVACGMAVGYQLYEHSKAFLEKHSSR